MTLQSPVETDGLAAALRLLLEATRCARDVNLSEREFAVDFRALRGAGISDTGIRWLCHKGYILHVLEQTSTRDQRRRFQSTDVLALFRRSCFVLSREGELLARQLLDLGESWDPVTQPSVHPIWDADRRELRVRHTVVKHFRRPAPVQEMILAVFQETGWSERILDPLPRTRDADSRERLHNAINRLNSAQKVRLLVFTGDGTGQGIRWGWRRQRNRSRETGGLSIVRHLPRT